jgi:glycine/serine hydroxymethyltransferase
MEQVAGWLDRVLVAKGEAGETARVRDEIRHFCRKFPLFH